MLRCCAPGRRCRALLDRLDDDHARGERKIRNLEHALLGFEMMGESRRMEFESAVGRFADFYLEHMALEKREILPLAERVRTPEDWRELDEAFSANRETLTGCTPDAPYQALFTRIVNMGPAQLGLGTEVCRRAGVPCRGTSSAIEAGAVFVSGIDDNR